MKKLLLCLLSVCLLCACNRENDEPVLPNPEPTPEVEQAPLTLFVYLVADTNIKTDLRNNIKHKNWSFKALEGIVKVEAEAPDMEEADSVEGTEN